MTKHIVHFELRGAYTTDADNKDEAIDKFNSLESFNKLLEDIDEWYELYTFTGELIEE